MTTKQMLNLCSYLVNIEFKLWMRWKVINIVNCMVRDGEIDRFHTFCRPNLIQFIDLCRYNIEIEMTVDTNLDTYIFINLVEVDILSFTFFDN